MNEGWGITSDGSMFRDAQRSLGMDLTPAPITAASYGMYADFADNTGRVNLTGGAFGDYLFGGSGNDLLEGGKGINWISGGAGVDTVSYEHGDDSVTVNLSRSEASNLDATISESFSGIENVRGSDHDDTITGNSRNNVIEGGSGADIISGGGGNDTASYAHSGAGVTIDLGDSIQFGSLGDGAGDRLSGIVNLLGSAFDDSLTGDGSDNTLNGNGGADALMGFGGDDRLVIGATPSNIDGGEGTDLLFVQGSEESGIIALSDASVIDIEKTYVRNGTFLDMSAVGGDEDLTGSVIVSQSTVGHSILIVGSQDADRISGGKGSDGLAGGAGDDRIVAGSGDNSIFGGSGSDKLFGGIGIDTFVFEADSGRDNVYRFTVGTDLIDVSDFVENRDDITITDLNNGNVLVTFVGDTDPTHKIIVHDVLAAALTDASFIIGGV